MALVISLLVIQPEGVVSEVGVGVESGGGVGVGVRSGTGVGKSGGGDGSGLKIISGVGVGFDVDSNIGDDVGAGDIPGVEAKSDIEVKVLAFLTAKAIQLNLISCGADLFKIIENPLTLFPVTKYFTSLAKIASSSAEVLEESPSMDALALTIGCSRYSLSNVTSTFLSPDLITAKPAVSELKYGRPKKIESLLNKISLSKALILSTTNPWTKTRGEMISKAAASRSVVISDRLTDVANCSF